MAGDNYSFQQTYAPAAYEPILRRDTRDVFCTAADAIANSNVLKIALGLLAKEPSLTSVLQVATGMSELGVSAASLFGPAPSGGDQTTKDALTVAGSPVAWAFLIYRGVIGSPTNVHEAAEFADQPLFQAYSAASDSLNHDFGNLALDIADMENALCRDHGVDSPFRVPMPDFREDPDLKLPANPPVVQDDQSVED